MGGRGGRQAVNGKLSLQQHLRVLAATHQEQLQLEARVRLT